jgi:hypothetical protein
MISKLERTEGRRSNSCFKMSFPKSRAIKKALIYRSPHNNSNENKIFNNDFDGLLFFRIIKRTIQTNYVPFMWNLAGLSVIVPMYVVLGMDKWKMWWAGYPEELHLLFLFRMTSCSSSSNLFNYPRP